MTEHTPTPWALVGKGDVKSVCKGFPEAMVAKVLGQPTKAERTANGDFLIKAVNNHAALLTFFRWAMQEGPWEGGDLDGGSVQDKAESLGLIVKTKFDPAKHSDRYGDHGAGDDWFEYAHGLITAAVGTDQQPR